MPRERAVSEVKEPHSISLKVLRYDFLSRHSKKYYYLADLRVDFPDPPWQNSMHSPLTTFLLKPQNLVLYHDSRTPTPHTIPTTHSFSAHW